MKNLLRAILISLAVIATCLSVPVACRTVQTSAPTVELSQGVVDRPKTTSNFLEKYPLVTWLHKTPPEIGCMLEKEFAYRDPVFNCSSKHYKNKGSACENTNVFYEGVEIPNELARKVLPIIDMINLNFEGGRLQNVWIIFKEPQLKDTIREVFNLPGAQEALPENIYTITFSGDQAISTPTDPQYVKWFSISGFVHMGAGDVDCPGEEPASEEEDS